MYEDHTLSRAGDTVRFDSALKGLADKPPEDGFCVVEARESQAEADTAPCIGSSTIVGTMVADL